MSTVELREVLACSQIDEMPIPSTPSFNCECEQCRARIWVEHQSNRTHPHVCGLQRSA